MQNKNQRQFPKGFTLIELLVVVLIIGILAAVALPQYQKAVAKSRFATLKPIAKAIKDTQEFYYNEHGSYAASAELGDLSITIPAGVDTELSSTNNHEYVSVGHDKLNNRYRIYFDHSENFAGNIYCEALTADDPLCIAEGGQKDGPTQGQYTLYLLSGNSAGSFAPTYTTSSCGDSCTQYTNGENIIQVDSSSGYAIRVKENCNASPSQCQIYEFWDSGIPRDYNEKLLCERYPFIEQCQ